MKLGRVASLFLSPLLLPLMFVAAALSIPYTKIRRRTMARREARFAESMKLKGRIMDWTDFIRDLDQGNGVLIVERFSFKGPIRLWWTRDDLYKTCPYPLVDWGTMRHFDPVRDWFHARYTGDGGAAMLVAGTTEQWCTIRGDKPMTWREGIQWVEIPPPQKS